MSPAAPPVAPVDQLSPQHQKEQQYAQYTGHYPSDNVDIAKTPILAGWVNSLTCYNKVSQDWLSVILENCCKAMAWWDLVYLNLSEKA